MNRTATSRRASILFGLLGFLEGSLLFSASADAQVYFRANQVGYRPKDIKVAISFSDAPIAASFSVVDVESGKSVFVGRTRGLPGERWAAFDHHAELDFSAFSEPGRFKLQVGDVTSLPFTISE